jgi:hypothetical protein
VAWHTLLFEDLTYAIRHRVALSVRGYPIGACSGRSSTLPVDEGGPCSWYWGIAAKRRRYQTNGVAGKDSANVNTPQGVSDFRIRMDDQLMAEPEICVLIVSGSATI